MSEFLSYAQFIKDRNNFRNSGTNSGAEFNRYDFQSHKYFKILFYFGDGYAIDSDGLSSGLLSPTWNAFNEKPMNEDTINIVNKKLPYSDLNTNKFKKLKSEQKTDYHNYNSAWAYLKMNAEDERADKLEQFVTLLSNINTYSPWYFNSISGLDAAINRPVTETYDKFEIENDKKLTITCLPDAFDNRLTTLLELYREVTWSWVQKKEIIPANLRKFDMAIYIFETPTDDWHTFEGNKTTSLDGMYKTTYKLLEFHDCEFNYNSLKSGWSEINNQMGNSPIYNIEISYNDCYDISYNEILMKNIGDVILTDTQIVTSTDSVQMSPNLITQSPISESVKNSILNQSAKSLNNPIIDNTVKTDTKFNSKLLNRINSTITFGNLADNDLQAGKRQEKLEYEPGFLTNAKNQLVGTVKKHLNNKLFDVILGNIYGYSISDIDRDLSTIIYNSGDVNVFKAVNTVVDKTRTAQQLAADKIKKKLTENIFNNNTIANNV